MYYLARNCWVALGIVGMSFVFDLPILIVLLIGFTYRVWRSLWLEIMGSRPNPPSSTPFERSMQEILDKRN